ncbi:MAG: iron-sulfur cluster assembly accessory protein [SAR202 cluster bacterium]|nr:iron-sulfur cluster assembly accessory protein [SAR202 cluster bacterium]
MDLHEGMPMTTARPKPKPLTITITPDAAEHVRVFAAEAGKSGNQLRVSVKGGGCSGLTYVLDLVDEFKEDDKVIEDQGMKLGVDRKSYVFLAGTALEYYGGLNGTGFVFNNPNAKTTCGCGTSFGV